MLPVAGPSAESVDTEGMERSQFCNGNIRVVVSERSFKQPPKERYLEKERKGGGKEENKNIPHVRPRWGQFPIHTGSGSLIRQVNEPLVCVERRGRRKLVR